METKRNTSAMHAGARVGFAQLMMSALIATRPLIFMKELVTLNVLETFWRILDKGSAWSVRIRSLIFTTQKQPSALHAIRLLSRVFHWMVTAMKFVEMELP